MARKPYDSRKVNVVGRFFENITECLLIKAERAPIKEGDFHIWDKGIGVEVKASDSQHEFRLPIHQLESYKRMSEGFPLDCFFFSLFSYNNPYLKNGKLKKITSLSQFDDEIEIRSFLSSEMINLYVLDMAIMPFLFSICRISNKSIPLHPGVESLNVRPRLLNSLAEGGWKVIDAIIRDVGIETFTFNFKYEPDLLEAHQIRLKIVTIGRKNKLKQLKDSFVSDLVL